MAVWGPANARCWPRVPATRVTLLVGAADFIAPKELSQEYYHRLQQQGVPVTLFELPEIGHEIFLTKAVNHEISRLLH